MHNKGFTLVELAIVMTIIGLLIGGVLKGQEMIQNARITRTISDVKAYQAAMVSFRDTYGSFPGDFPLATSRLPGCTAASFCVNGDGNGMVGLETTTWSAEGGSGPGYPDTNQAGTDSAPQVETTMFWKHMAIANLISGIDPSSNPEAPEWGKTHPSSSFHGGFHALYSSTTKVYVGAGVVLRLQGSVNSKAWSTPQNTVLSPRMAERLDCKADDCLPIQGWVRGGPWGDGASNCIDGPSRTYMPYESKRCVMFFNIL